MSLVQSSTAYGMTLQPRAPDQRAVAFTRCPCSAHGGFSRAVRTVRPRLRIPRPK